MSAQERPLLAELHVAESRASAEMLLTRAGEQIEAVLTHGNAMARLALIELVACGFSLGRAQGQRDALESLGGAP